MDLGFRGHFQTGIQSVSLSKAYRRWAQPYAVSESDASKERHRHKICNSLVAPLGLIHPPAVPSPFSHHICQGAAVGLLVPAALNNCSCCLGVVVTCSTCCCDCCVNKPVPCRHSTLLPNMLLLLLFCTALAIKSNGVLSVPTCNAPGATRP